MSVFEDLIGELKEENLLEDTILESSIGTATAPQLGKPVASTIRVLQSGGIVAGTAANEIVGAPKAHSDTEIETDGLELSSKDELSGADFYRKRAMAEVSSLQMVEHVLSGIEREYLKTVPVAYDDLEPKKALHRFLKIGGAVDTVEFAEAEIALIGEVESWSTALCKRDKNVSVANLRRFCENSRPALSSQALIALARFFRNSPFAEATRAKFDYVITRLFSREEEGQKRKLLFPPGEIVEHLRALYANWASILLFSADDVESDVGRLVSEFKAKAVHAESAGRFDELSQQNFFDELHKLKTSTRDLFFIPEVAAAAIDCNVRIGNRFVEMIRLEMEVSSSDLVEQKYGYTYDQILSEAAGKTLHLVDLLKFGSKPPLVRSEKQKPDTHPPPQKIRVTKPVAKAALRLPIFKVNKWLAAATIAVILLSSMAYFGQGR
ncbi:MAG: hypothetical protein LC734_00260 [Acidobacteria bacterium]|nr:hypothetical protein [Acidobacteriota bacterium]